MPGKCRGEALPLPREGRCSAGLQPCHQQADLKVYAWGGGTVEPTEGLPYGGLVRRRAFAATLFGAEEEVEAALTEFRRRQAATGPLLPLEDYARRREAVITRRMRAKEARFLARSRSHLRQSADE